MKIKELWFYVAGFALGAILAAIIASWGEATMAYRIGFVALLGSLVFAAWFKEKSHKGNNTADDDQIYTLAVKPTSKSNDDPN